MDVLSLLAEYVEEEDINKFKSKNFRNLSNKFKLKQIYFVIGYNRLSNDRCQDNTENSVTGTKV